MSQATYIVRFHKYFAHWYRWRGAVSICIYCILNNHLSVSRHGAARDRSSFSISVSTSSVWGQWTETPIGLPYAILDRKGALPSTAGRSLLEQLHYLVARLGQIAGEYVSPKAGINLITWPECHFRSPAASPSLSSYTLVPRDPLIDDVATERTVSHTWIIGKESPPFHR